MCDRWDEAGLKLSPPRIGGFSEQQGLGTRGRSEGRGRGVVSHFSLSQASCSCRFTVASSPVCGIGYRFRGLVGTVTPPSHLTRSRDLTRLSEVIIYPQLGNPAPGSPTLNGTWPPSHRVITALGPSLPTPFQHLACHRPASPVRGARVFCFSHPEAPPLVPAPSPESPSGSPGSEGRVRTWTPAPGRWTPP